MSGTLSIQLDRETSVPLYVQLYQCLQNLIVNGELGEGYRLPPIRKLAQDLGVNNVTVVNAYKLLEQNGYARSRMGSGIYVEEPPEESESWQGSTDLGESLGIMDSLYLENAEQTIDFASATPTPELFPVGDFKTVINEVLDRDQGYAFSYQEGQGFFPLRESISAYLGRQGIITTPENIQIISGAQQGIDILAKAFLNFGDYIFTESPTYTGAMAVFRSRGAKIIDVSMEPDGLNMQELEDKLRRFRPKFIYVMPELQNPTGYSYSIAKRHKLLNLAKRYEVMIIEDDYQSELDFSDTILAPLKALDRENRVIYLKSFSKIFMPGLRLGFLLAPKGLHSSVLAAKHTSDIFTSGLIQRALDLYLRKGIWERHIDYMRRIYQERYTIMLESLKECIPDTVTYYPPRGGLTFWLKVPEGIHAAEICEKAAKKGVLAVPGKAFFPRSKPDHFLRLSFAAAYPDQIRRGIKILGDIIKEAEINSAG